MSLLYTFLLVAFPAVALAQWYLERPLMRRAILQLLKAEKPGKGQLGSHRVILSEDRVVERTAAYTSPAAAHVIPKRAFRNMQEVEAFYQLSRIRKEAAA